MERIQRLEDFVEILLENKGFAKKLHVADFQWLCEEIKPVLLAEPSVLDLQPPLKICGDIHGQFHDLLRVFDSGFVPENKFLFLGDYVDRGDDSLEVIGLLFALKLLYPDNIFLLRGNHESPEMTEEFGFLEECELKLNSEIFDVFMDTFDCLPIAALVGEKLFCVHGGLSPQVDTIDQIRLIRRPTAVPEDGVLADLLWSDPNPETEEWGPNSRGATITWGLRAAKKFIENNHLLKVIRGHQLANNGFDFPFSPDESVITVFTASYYAQRYANKAAFIAVDEDCNCEFHILPHTIPVIKLSRSSSSESSLAPPPISTPPREYEQPIKIPGTPRQKMKN